MMRRVIAVLLIGAFSVLSAGCLAVVSNKGYGSDRERVVVKDGEFYVVDLKNHTARRVEIIEVDEVETIESTEVGMAR